MTDLGSLGNGVGQAFAINASGQIVGTEQFSGSSYHGFLWQNGVMIDIGNLGGTITSASGINDYGLVVGESQLSNGQLAAFFWQNGVMHALPGSAGFVPSAINNAGTIAGAGGQYGGCVWQSGEIVDLNPLTGGTRDDAYAINNVGQVVGWSGITGGTQHACLWNSPNNITDLGALSQQSSFATSVNDAGQVVGWSFLSDNTTIHAFLWENGVLTDLNSIVPVKPGWVLQKANGINNAGQIVGTASYQADQFGFILTKNPTAKAQTVSLIMGKPTAITLSGADYDNPPLKLIFAIAAQPANGDLTGLNTATGAVTYTPNSGFKGTDSFTFTVTNGTKTSTTATISLIVAPGIPVANAQTVAFAHDVAKSITLIGKDPDVPALPLSYAIAKAPAHGTLGTLNSSTGAVTYTPGATYYGPDSFTFTVTNGTTTSAAATVTINVAIGTPTANPQTVPVAHNTAKAITLTGSDPDIPDLELTFAIVTSPAHGSLSALNATTHEVTYTPAANYQGADSFTFTISNGTNKSSAAKVTLAVAAGTPAANAQTVSIAHNTAKAIALTGSDPDVPALKLTYAIVTSPAHGTLGTLNTATGAVTYTPTANYQGTDSFTFTVSSGTNKSAAATVSLKIAPGTPTANPQTVPVTLSTRITITLTGSDPDVPALKLSFAIATKPTHGILGSLNTSTGVLVYTPIGGYKGADSFTFTVSNGTNKSAPAKVTLNVGG
jgi:probable HAF family extracellular repeat protein